MFSSPVNVYDCAGNFCPQFDYCASLIAKNLTFEQIRNTEYLSDLAGEPCPYITEEYWLSQMEDDCDYGTETDDYGISYCCEAALIESNYVFYGTYYKLCACAWIKSWYGEESSKY